MAKWKYTAVLKHEISDPFDAVAHDQISDILYRFRNRESELRAITAIKTAPDGTLLKIEIIEGEKLAGILKKTEGKGTVNIQYKVIVWPTSGNIEILPASSDAPPYAFVVCVGPKAIVNEAITYLLKWRAVTAENEQQLAAECAEESAS